ncbi:exo-alpha-sialidase [Jiangella muralis]|uniref:exo-alpha-sialidase n=1 Tax=Jiangella muralis TaxID=702383 RepID=UPI00069E87CD|nr:exo-alpha-sialidase [Jiangella muralis]
MSQPIARRTFLALSATTMATAALPAVTAGRAAAAPTALASTNGWTATDVNPFASSLTGLGAASRLALDYDHRSVGADLGSVKAFTAVEIVQESTLSRLNSRDLALYVSNDNAAWERADAEHVDLGGSTWHYLGTARTARYVKLHSHRGDTTGFTCVITDLQAGLRVYDLGPHEFVGGNGGSWAYRTPVVITNANPATLRDRAAFLSFQTLGTAALIAAGKLAPDLRDLRIADASGRELHAYSNSFGVYIRVPQIAAGSSVTVYAYSGNPGATNRIDRDTGALQVQYGHRILQRQPASADAIKVAQLPSGRMITVSTAPSLGGINARYSTDGGRSWGALETFKAFTGAPGAKGEGPQGLLWDPVRGVLTFFFRISFAYTEGGDFTDPAQNNVQTYVIQASSFTATGRPVWGTARHVPLVNQATGSPVAWALSYTNPIRTSSGAYLHAMSYIVRPDGTFVSNVIRSADGGLTWTQSIDELALPGQFGFEKGITEPAIAELGDGSIAILARQQLGRKSYLAASRSIDDGVTWSAVTDSTVLSSNTQPAMFPGTAAGSHVLTWSGHNGFSQTSYYRNNLTAAYSDDDGASWHGYQDLLGATELSAPGWAAVTDLRQVQNADSAPSGTGDRLFGWITPGDTPKTMLVEEFDRYVRDSQGALDTVNYRKATGTANGTELADWRWWRSSRTGTLDFITGQRASRRAVRLRSSANADASASRLFPAIRRGYVRAAIRLTANGGGFRLCLQEGFSDSDNAPGTALSLLVTPSGEVRATTSDTFVTTADIGHQNDDTTPADGRLIALGQYGAVGFDYQNRSLGADLYTTRTVSSIEVVDNDLVGPAGNRLDPSQLRIWRSSDNAAWTEVTGWTGVETGSVITLSGPSFSARYVKVSQPYGDTAFTFANERSRILRVLPDLGSPQAFAPLTTPTSLTTGSWHQLFVDVDLQGGAIAVSVDGTLRATLPLVHPAQVVSHLFLAFDAASTAGDVAVDELIVQDTAGGMPAVSSVGTTVPVP